MKKLSLFLSAMLISIMSFAGTVTFEVGQDKLEGHTPGTAAVLTKDGVTLDVSKGAFGRDDNFRIYAGFGMTISCEYGNITGVEITCTAAAGGTQYGPDFITTSVGTYTYADKVGTWTGDEASVSFSATKQVRFTKLVVTYASSDANFVSQPMITGDINFADTANVVITVDEGMKIYYTLDGSDPTTASTEYTTPFEVYATTTVKAIAYNEATAVSSLVTETVFTQATKVTCEEAAAAAVLVSGNNVLTDLTYNVKGYVTVIAGEYNTETSRQLFWLADTKDGGKVLYAYNCVVPAEMTIGTKVQIVGKLTKWNTGQEIQPQIINAKVTILPEEPVVVEKEEYSSCPAGTLVDGKVIHELECCTIVQEQGESTSTLTTKSPWAAPKGSIMTITPKEGVSIKQFLVNIGNTTYATYFNYATLTNATMTKDGNTFTITATEGTEPIVINFVKASQFKEVTFTYTIAGGTADPEPVKYTVTVSAENGTVEGAGEYEEGAEATLTAIANEGYEFVNWTVADSVVSTENPYTFVVTADIALVANFKE